MGEERWDERADDFHDKPVRTIIKATLMIFAFAAVVGGGVWAYKVLISDIKGRGDSEIIKNDARNRIRAQEGFEDMFAAVKTADKNLSLTADALRAMPDSVKLQTELTGQQMICNDLVGRYDAAARKFTQEEFRAADLPARIDAADEATDCKESK